MNNLVNTLNTYRPYVLALVRVAVGYIFMLHGATKLLAMPETQMSGVALASMAGVAGVMELFGGALLIVGLLTRPVAFLLSGEMAYAYFFVHAAKPGTVLLPILNGGDAAVLYCFIFFYFVFSGAGAFAVDNVICKNRA